MSFRSIILSLSCYLLIAFTCEAQTAQDIQTYKTLVQNSLNQLSQANKDKQWAYTRTTIQGKGKEQQTTIENFDPSKPQPQQWTLIEDKGNKPTDKQQQSYRKQQVDKVKQAKENQDEEKALIDMVKFDSLAIIEEKPQQTTLSFTPSLDKMGEDSEKHLAGTIIFDRNTNQVSQLLIENTGELSPALSVSIKQFSMAFSLTYRQRSLLPENINIDIYGKAAVFTTIDQKTQEIYSNYRYVGTNKITAQQADNDSSAQ